MPYEIKPLRKEDLEAAAKLFVKSFKIEREHSPLLPSRFEDVNVILPSLDNLLSKSPGVAAVSNNKLVGFLIGQLLPSWRGRRSVWVPECANVVVGQKRKEVFREMYARLAYEWVANGCFTHLISVLAHDEEIIDELFWLGFGMAAVDAIRDLGDAEGPFADVEVRRAGVNDLEAVGSLNHEYGRYMAESPTFMALVEKSDTELQKATLPEPSSVTWLALYEGAAVSHMGIGPSQEDASYVIQDEKTASITKAFTKKHVRGRGIGATLLKHSLDWAKSEGFERCAVDFEPENVLGRSFWLRHFRPVSFALIRQIDGRIGWAHKDRKDEHFW